MFPGRDSRELHDLALRTYRSYARDVIDFIRSLRMTPEATRRLVGRIETGRARSGDGRRPRRDRGVGTLRQLGDRRRADATSHAVSSVGRRQVRGEPSGRDGCDSRCARRWRSTRSKCGSMSRPRCASANDCRRMRSWRCCSIGIWARTRSKCPSLAGRRSFCGRRRFLRPCRARRSCPVSCTATKGRLAVECGPLIRVPAEGDRDANVRRRGSAGRDAARTARAAASAVLVSVLSVLDRRESGRWLTFVTAALIGAG